MHPGSTSQHVTSIATKPTSRSSRRFARRSIEKAKSDKQALPYRVSLLPLVVKCTVAALKAFPLFNSALVPAKDALIQRNYWNIGVAVDTADGLVVRRPPGRRQEGRDGDRRANSRRCRRRRETES